MNNDGFSQMDYYQQLDAFVTDLERLIIRYIDECELRAESIAGALIFQALDIFQQSTQSNNDDETDADDDEEKFVMN